MSAPIVDEQHPWIGLEYFTEKLLDYFYGRAAEAEELFRGVKREPLTVFFGTSGLGKTSLLRAGLFPALRAEGFLPVNIRLDHKASTKTPISQVKAALTEAITAAHISQPTLPDAGETLWEYFHRDDLHLETWSSQPVTPVLVFDQFEELFTLGARDAAQQKYEEFFTELSDLIENHRPARVRERLRSHPGQVANFDFGPANVRVLFSLREDYLARLEAYSKLIPSISRNRMPLTRMNGEQALDAVILPGADLVSHEVGDQIVRFVAAAGKREATEDNAGAQGNGLHKLEVEPALLSLFCRELNDQRIEKGLPQITADLVEKSSGQILRNYYEKCLAGQARGARVFVEEELLTADGYRDDMEFQRAKEELGKRGAAPACLDELIETRLLHRTRRGETLRVELTHDVLTGVVRDSRNERRLREAEEEAKTNQREAEALLLRERAEAQKKLAEKRRQLRWMTIAAVVVLGIAIYALVQKNVAERARNQASLHRQQARVALREANKQRDGAQSLKAAWQGVNMAREKLDLALLLSAEAFRRLDGAQETKSALVTSLLSSPHLNSFLRGHSPETTVRSLAFSPDGQTLASADGSGMIILWYPDSGFMVHKPVPVHNDYIFSIAFSPDGRYLASASADKTVKLMNVASGAVEKLAESAEFNFRSVAFRSDGKELAAACGDGRVRLWNLAGEKPSELPSLVHHDRKASPADVEVNTVAFSRDGKLLASAGEDDQLVVWDVKAARQRKTAPLGEEERPVFRVAFSPDGKWIATSSASGAVTLWDAESQKLTRVFGPAVEHDRGIYGLEFSADSKSLASASADQSVRLWDVAAMKERRAESSKSLEGYSEGVYAIAFRPGTEMLATGHNDGTVALWDLSGQPRLARPVEMVSGDVEALAFSPGGKRLASAQGKAIVVWNLEKRKWQSGALQGHIWPVTSVAASPRGSLIASASQDTTIRLWDGEGGRQIGPSLKGHTGSVNAVAFNPLGNLLASASDDKTIRLWKIGEQGPDGVDARLIGELTGHTDAVFNIAFSPDGNTLVSCGRDKTVRLWDIQSRKQISEPLAKHTAPVFRVAFSPDGSRIASGDRDGSIILWDRATGQPLPAKIPGHNGASVIGLAFHPNGKTLLSAGWRSGVMQWNLDTGKAVDPPLSGLGSDATSLAVDSGSGTVAAGSADAIHVLNLADPKIPGFRVESALQRVWALAISHDGATLAAGGNTGNIILWDTKTNHQKGVPLRTDETGITRLIYSPDDKVLGAVSKRRIVFWNLDTGVEVGRLAEENDITDAVFDHAGARLATGTESGAINLWNWPSVERRGERLPSHTDGVRSLAFSSDDQWLLSSARDETLMHHELSATPNSSKRLNYDVMRIACSPDGKTLVFGERDGRIFISDTSSNSTSSIEHHTVAIDQLALSPDGKELASTNWGRLGRKAITIIDIAARQTIGVPLSGHEGDITGVVFGDQGKTIFSADDEGVILRWNLDVDSWQTLAASLAGRGITEDEATRYLGKDSRPSLTDATTLLKRADSAALRGDPNARALLGEAVRAAITSKDPEVSNLVCWMGSVDGFSDLVLEAGERAVEVADEGLKGYYRDTRGLARALAGKKQDAIDDFRAFIAWAESHNFHHDRVTKRQEWIQKLEAGEQPFAAEVLLELRNESMGLVLD